MNLVRIAWSKLSEGMYETVSLPTEVAKQTFAKNFLNNLLRASIKHLPFFGSFLYDVIYGTIDSQAPQNEKVLQRQAHRSSTTFPKQKRLRKDKRASEKWYKTSTFKYVVVPLAATLIVAIPAWIALFHKDSTESVDGGTTSAQNKLPTSLREICQDIDSRPLVQRDETAKRYIGIKIERERLKLFDIHEYPEDGTFGLIMTLPDKIDESYLTGRKIFFTVERNQYPELNAAKKGLQLYVSGQIKDARSSYIRLSDVSLSFE